jgi:transposase
MPRKHFTKEFKQSAVKLAAEGGGSINQAARDLGVHDGTLRYWIKLHRQAQGAGEVQESRALRTRVRALEEEVRRLTLERDILKKAAAFFAREEDRP